MACRFATCAVLACAACMALAPSHAQAAHPDSPEVRAVVQKALKYLETASDSRLGGKCLIGLAFLKDGADEQHPKVAEAVQACQNAAKPEADKINNDIYSTGIAIIFLCSLNPSKYSPEILKLRESLERRQKSHGGWGYPDRDTGDTSMTQYAVLAWWEMRAVGLPTSVQSTERVADWLLRTQDPEGNWGYQGKEADDVRHLVKQDPNRIGMTAAGMGMTYMVADLLNLSNLQTNRDAELPPALRLVRKEVEQKPLTAKIDVRSVRSAQIRGRDWIRKNYKIDPPTFPHYYLYALERYQSFAEAAEGRFIKEPKWYNDGYGWLKKTQEPDGSWKDRENMDAVNTAFGALFLLRSTRKAIERSKSYGEGSLLAGRGFPDDVKAVRVRGGYVVPKEPAASTGALLGVLARPTDPDFASVVADVELLSGRISAARNEERQQHVERLESLAEIGAPDARLAAVQILGKLRSLESSPALIRALDDADWRVVQAAEVALKVISRDSSPSQLGGSSDRQAQQAVAERWKSWFLSFSPDAELAR